MEIGVSKLTVDSRLLTKKSTSLRGVRRRSDDVAISGRIVSLNISVKKGQKKQPVDSIYLVKDKGVKDDAHFDSKRQVSLLPLESIKRMQDEGLKVKAGSFAENITIEGLKLSDLRIGTKLKMGNSLVEITEIGKECHSPCAIYKQAGYCVMPEDGVFAKVIKNGEIYKGDVIAVL